jgi:hypothetical protein
MMRVLPGTLLFDALKSAFRESLRSCFSLTFCFRLGRKMRQTPSSFPPDSKQAPPYFVHAGKHRFRQRYLAGRCASVSAFLLLEPLRGRDCHFICGSRFQLHPIAGIYSARPLLFSGDALSYVSLRKEQPRYERDCKTKCDCSAASLLYPQHGWPASAA